MKIQFQKLNIKGKGSVIMKRLINALEIFCSINDIIDFISVSLFENYFILSPLDKLLMYILCIGLIYIIYCKIIDNIEQ